MPDCGHGWSSKTDCDICTLKRVNPQACDRIEELEIALRAALSFVQGRHTDHNDGHAQMVIAALRGALRKPRD